MEPNRAITRDVLEAQASLLAAQNARMSALVNYMTASLSFARDVGTLQLRPDGTWVEKQSGRGGIGGASRIIDRQQEIIGN